MLGNFFGKMQEEQAKVKEKLDQLVIDSSFQNGQIIIKITGNKKIKDIHINEALFQENDKEMLQELLTEAINNAIAEAEARSQQEMKNVLKDIMPNIPGMKM